MTKKAADLTTTPHTSDKPLTPGTPRQYTVHALGLDLLDTTWRIAVPVIIFALLGIIADRSFGTKPWMTLSGVVIGFIFAGLLIKKLLASIAKRDA